MDTMLMNNTALRRRGTVPGKPFSESTLVQIMIIFCIVVCLGFPGGLTDIIGNRLGKMMEYIGFGIEILIILLSSSSEWKEIELLRLDRQFAIMYVYVVFTFVTSMIATSYPTEQIITCLRLMVTLLFSIWMVQHYNLERLVTLIVYSQAVFIIITILFMVRYPGLAYESSAHFTNALTGLYNTKNACAAELSFGILITILMIRMRFHSRRLSVWLVILLFVQIGLLMLCQATGAVIGLIVALLPFFLFREFRLPLGLIYIVGNVVFLFLMLTLMPLFEDVILALGKDPTLTGRIPMWKRIIDMMLESKTLLGYGYGMFWRNPTAVRGITSAFDMKDNPFMATLATGAHNVILEMWLNSGLLGIAMFFFMIFASFYNIKYLDEENYIFCVVLFTFIFMNGLTERCLGSNYDYKMFIIFILMAIGYNVSVPQGSLVRRSRLNAAGQTPAAGTGR